MKYNNSVTGGIHKDKRGVIRYVNDFDFKGIKRFYQIDLPRKNMIRAFHGHFKESKHVFVISGQLLLCVVKINDKITPSKKNKVKKIILNSDNPQIYNVPQGYANGIMSLKPNTRVIFFSNKTLQESLNDDFRFDKNYWGEMVWEND
jgi:dTDP-4-dehydrorhamnose 3,5-epimerase-like enzyme